MDKLNVEDLFSNPTYADNQYKIICQEIKDFQDTLDKEHEVGLITPNNSYKPFVICEMGYHNPSLIYFYGYIDGQIAQIIQNVNQINLSLVAVQKENGKPARRIGFSVD